MTAETGNRRLRLPRQTILKVFAAGAIGATVEAVVPGGLVRRITGVVPRDAPEAKTHSPISEEELSNLILNINQKRIEKGQRELKVNEALALIADSTAKALAEIDPVAKNRRYFAPQIAKSISQGAIELLSGYAAAFEAVTGERNSQTSQFSVLEVDVFSAITARGTNGKKYALIEDYKLKNPSTRNDVNNLDRLIESTTVTDIGVGGAIDHLGNRISVIVVARIE